MISDSSYDELHDFAARVGIPPRAFERDHYDVIAERYDVAVAAGAHRASSREIVTSCTGPVCGGDIARCWLRPWGGSGRVRWCRVIWWRWWLRPGRWRPID